MYTLIRKNGRYLVASGVLLLFGLVYEYFSHGIYSFYMYGAWLIPLIFILINIVVDQVVHVEILNMMCYKLLGLTLVIASIIKGVIAIYGTTNPLVQYYWGFIAAALVGLFLEIIIELRISTKQ